MIVVDGLKKSYGKTLVLKGISFRVGKGCVHGYLGHNGSGKTTTIRIILGLLSFDKGCVTVLGENLDLNPSVKAQIGYVSDNPGLYPSLSVRGNLLRFSMIKGLSNPEAEVDREINESDLGDYANTPIKKLSGGYRQRTCIARALLGNPKLLILDEPFRNIDAQSKYKLKNRLKRLREKGVSIFITTHVLGDIDDMCDELTLLKNGKIYFSGKFSSLKEDISFGAHYLISTNDNSKAFKILSQDYSVQTTNDHLKILAGKEDREKIAELLVGFKIYNFERKIPGLESIYSQILEEKQ